MEHPVSRKKTTKRKVRLKIMQRCSSTTYIQSSFSLIFLQVTGPVKKEAVKGSAGYIYGFLFIPKTKVFLAGTVIGRFTVEKFELYL